jgi:hypothetical protein
MLFHFFTALIFLDVVICSARIRHRDLPVEHGSFVNHQACGPNIAADNRFALEDKLVDRDDIAANLSADGNILSVDVPLNFTGFPSIRIFPCVRIFPSTVVPEPIRFNSFTAFFSAMAAFLTHSDSIAIMYSSGFCGWPSFHNSK